MQLVFASSNKNKIKEIRALMPASVNLAGLSDIGCEQEIPETAATIEGNALLKAAFVYNNYNMNCFADDSGLEVLALNDAPGVYSARYASEPKNDLQNIRKLLQNLKGKTDRRARFKTVIALIIGGKEHCFEGIINGTISTEMKGSNGFGYDPVFIPEGRSATFAEMTADEKNK
ncbi:MAG: RdgB/HAM1 family non-canonical purine NTP pyrophosphatase, partial [Bacteroidia bacterium]